MLSRETFQETFKRLIQELAKIRSIPVLKQKIQSLSEQRQQLIDLQQNALNNSIKRFLLPKDIQNQIAECEQALQQNQLLLQRYEILLPFASSLEKSFSHILQESQSTQMPFSEAKLQELHLSMATIKSDLLNLLDPHNDLNGGDITLICKAMQQRLKILKDTQHIEMIDHTFLIDINEKKEWDIEFKFEVELKNEVPQLVEDDFGFYDGIEFEEDGITLKDKVAVAASAPLVIASYANSVFSSSSSHEYMGPVLPATPVIDRQLSEEDKEIGILCVSSKLNELKREMLDAKKAYAMKIKNFSNEITRTEKDNKTLFKEMNSFETLIGMTEEQFASQRDILKEQMGSNEEAIKDYRSMIEEVNQTIQKLDLFLNLITNFIYEFKLARSKTLNYEEIALGVKEMRYSMAFFIDDDFTDEEKQNEATMLIKLFPILLHKHFPEPMVAVPALKPDEILAEKDKFKNTRAVLRHIVIMQEDLAEAVKKHINRNSILQSAEVELLKKVNGLQLYFMLNRDLKVRELADFALNTLETDKTKSDYIVNLYLSIYKVDMAVSSFMKERATARWQRMFGNKNEKVVTGRLPTVIDSAVAEPERDAFSAIAIEENFVDVMNANRLI